MRLSGVLLIVGALFMLTGCGDDDGSTDVDAAPTVTVTATPTAENTPSASPSETSTPEPEPALFPKGFPKVVPVATLPDQVKSWYEMDGTKKAVAIAPGVWAPLSPGATAEDAIAVGVYDGFCGSIKAYERKFTPGEEHAGTCW